GCVGVIVRRLEIRDKRAVFDLKDVRGELVFDHVTFRYDIMEENLLSEVDRPGRMDSVKAVLSLEDGEKSRTALAPDDIKPPSQARETTLEDLSFRIEPGQLVALVGPSGAGKTTMTYLIPRLYDPTEGRILLDDHDLRDVTQDSLAAQIGMVTQETHLFHDSIRTNLLYAKIDATQA